METAEESIIDESCYMQVIRKKTAMLLSACSEIGSISAGASGEMVEKCREFEMCIRDSPLPARML